MVALSRLQDFTVSGSIGTDENRSHIDHKFVKVPFFNIIDKLVAEISKRLPREDSKRKFSVQDRACPSCDERSL